jgi:beta-fructofuranosidase
LLFEPVPEVAGLRGAEHALHPMALAPREERLLPFGGDRLEIALRLAPGNAGCELTVRGAPDGSERTAIRCDPDAQTLSIDRTRASLAAGTLKDVQTAPLALRPDEPLELRVFLDSSIIEVYANRRRCLTSRVYPSRPDSTGLRLAASNGPVTVQELMAWEMNPIWPAET